jgi:cytochrome c6
MVLHRMVRGLVVLILGIVLIWALFWPPAAWGLPGDMPALLSSDGRQLFEQHCVGCHLNGGNVVRRGRTLKQAALLRNGITGPEDVARIAAAGIGRMSGYGAVLGEGGAEAVGRWVWQQALTGWPRG